MTRLHLRSIRFLPVFMLHASRARRQAEGTAGCMSAQVRKTRGLAFWTLTVWRDEGSLKQFMAANPHRATMPKLLDWCDEATIAQWTMPDANAPPTWDDAAAELRRTGRLSRVKHPSERHRQGIIDVN